MDARSVPGVFVINKCLIPFFVLFREKLPVHVVVDPVLGKVLRPHQREVNPRFFSWTLPTGGKVKKVYNFHVVFIITIELNRDLLSYIMEAFLNNFSSETFLTLELTRQTRAFICELWGGPWVALETTEKVHQWTISCLLSKKKYVSKFLRGWSSCGSVWRADASQDRTAASWLMRWAWGRLCSVSPSCGHCYAKALTLSQK